MSVPLIGVLRYLKKSNSSLSLEGQNVRDGVILHGMPNMHNVRSSKVFEHCFPHALVNIQVLVLWAGLPTTRASLPTIDGSTWPLRQ